MAKPPINLIYLKYFCDAVKHGSITASARENYVSQSAISQGIASLEKALGAELITHQTNRFKSTPEGLVIFEKSKTVFNSVQELEESLIVEEGVISGRIEFACMHSFALALLPQHLKKVQKECPKLHVNFKLAHTDVIKDLIRKGSIDFGIVLDNEDMSSFESFELYSGEYKLYVSNKIKKYESLPYIISEERVETNSLKRFFKKRFGKEMDVLMEVSSWEVIANLTEAGLGIGFFPDYVALKRMKYLKVVPYKFDPIPYKIYAIYPKSKKIPKNQLYFLESLKLSIYNFNN
ncbi:MAG: LysR family transcriptional regulator [Parachlamydiaceae bacterium]|nr:LysR family transcriptional regulator [Parachlamydiaceae bacterium]